MRASYRSDIQASPSELAHGLSPALPGSLLTTTQPSHALQDLLDYVKNKTTRKPVQTHLNVPNPTVNEPPPNVTHVYTRQHKQYGLDPPFSGPFKIIKRLSRSTVRIKVGTYADGSIRTADRHWSDLKAVKLENIQEENRPKLGRPKKQQPQPTPVVSTGPPNSKPFSNPETSAGKQPHPEYIKKGPIITEKMFDEANWPKILNIPTNNRPVRATRNPNPQYKEADAISVSIASIDFSKPPPSPQPKMWSANSQELDSINQSIAGRPVIMPDRPSSKKEIY